MPAGACLLSRMNEVSVAADAYSSVAPPVSRQAPELTPPPQLAARNSQSVTSVEAAAWVEMQWLAPRKYGVPDEAASFSSVPVQ